MKSSFKIDKKEYHFEDITIRKYYELKTILAFVDGENSQRETEFKIVEILTGAPTDMLKKLKYQDWLLVWEEATYTIGKLNGTTDNIKPTIEFKGVKYGLPAIDDLTVGEFSDLEIISSSPNAEDRLHEIAAVIYRPVQSQRGEILILEPYDTLGYRERVELFLDLPLTAIKSANAFFLQYATSSLKSIGESLLKNPKAKKTQSQDLELLQKLLQQDPGGELSILLQGKILLDLQKLPDSRYAQLSTGLHGKKTKLKRWLLKFKDKITPIK